MNVELHENANLWPYFKPLNSEVPKHTI